MRMTRGANAKERSRERPRDLADDETMEKRIMVHAGARAPGVEGETEGGAGGEASAFRV